MIATDGVLSRILHTWEVHQRYTSLLSHSWKVLSDKQTFTLMHVWSVRGPLPNLLHIWRDVSVRLQELSEDRRQYPVVKITRRTL
jgi:hypothetical protein